MKKYILYALFAAGCMSQKPTARIYFEAPGTYPEGIAYDQQNSLYYVSSARTGTIGRVTPNGAYSVLYSDTGLKSTYGIKIHPDGKRLFACVGDANYSKFTAPGTRRKMARVISIDLASGRKLTDTDLSGLVPGKHFPNDLVFDDKGNAYITDSYAHVIYKLDANGNADVFVKDKRFVTEGIGLNGIVYHPGGFLLVDNTNTGCIYKVGISDRKVEKVKLEQFFVGGDGLLLNENNKLTVVVNGGSGKIYQLETKDNWQSARLAASTLLKDRFNYPSTAVQHGENEVWVMNAKFNELVDSNAVPSKTFFIQQAVLKPLP